MVNEELRNYLSYINPELVILDNASYDNSIIGVSEDGCHVIYSKQKMIEEYMKDEDCSYEEAVEWIEYNTSRAIPYMGESHPIIMDELSITISLHH